MDTKLKEWYDAGKQGEVAPMSEDDTGLMMTFMLNPDGKMPEEVNESKCFELIEKRCKWIEVPVSEQVIAFLSVIGDGRPESMVMYCSYLKCWFMENNRPIDISELAHIFPMGFWTEKTMVELWKKQKSKEGYNLLDIVWA